MCNIGSIFMFSVVDVNLCNFCLFDEIYKCKCLFLLRVNLQRSEGELSRSIDIK